MPPVERACSGTVYGAPRLVAAASFVMVLSFACGEAEPVESRHDRLLVARAASVIALGGGDAPTTVYASASVEPLRALAYDDARDVLYSVQGADAVGFFVLDHREHRVRSTSISYEPRFSFDAGSFRSGPARSYATYRDRASRIGNVNGDVTTVNADLFGTPQQIVARREVADLSLADIDHDDAGVLYMLQLGRVLLRAPGDGPIEERLLPSDPSAASFSALAVANTTAIIVGTEEGRREATFATLLLKVDGTGAALSTLDAPPGVASWHVFSLDVNDGVVAAAVRLDEWVGVLMTDDQFSFVDLIDIDGATVATPVRSVCWAALPSGV